MKKRINYVKSERKGFKSTGRFQGLIDQMNRDRHKLVMVGLSSAKDFANECIRRGYDIEIGDATTNGIIIYRK